METEEQIQQALVERDNLTVQLSEINLGYDKMVDSILTDAIRQELAKIEEERKQATEQYQERLQTLEDEIKASVIQMGKSVKVEGVGYAIFNKGKVSWDGKRLEGMMLLIPELRECQSFGKPYVSFRKA